jgi:hypothetical protein
MNISCTDIALDPTVPSFGDYFIFNFGLRNILNYLANNWQAFATDKKHKGLLFCVQQYPIKTGQTTFYSPKIFCE